MDHGSIPPLVPTHSHPKPAGLGLVQWEEPGWFQVPGLLISLLRAVSTSPHLTASLPQVHINVSLLGFSDHPPHVNQHPTLLLLPLLFLCLFLPESTYCPLTCIYIFLFIICVSPCMLHESRDQLFSAVCLAHRRNSTNICQLNEFPFLCITECF